VKRFVRLMLFLLLVGAAGCAKEKSDGTAGAAATFPPEASISYGRGFYDLEQGTDGSTWRWMGEEGVVKLRNTRRDMRLKLSGDAPLERFPQPPTIKLEFNGEPLDQFTATLGLMEKEYTIPAAKQTGDWSELRISTDKSFVPKEVDKGATDWRRLGFSVSKLVWEPK